MKIKKKKETAVFTIVLPKDLNRKVETEAADKKRSKAKQIEWILEQHFSQAAQLQTN